MVRMGVLQAIALPHYAEWVAGAQWRAHGQGGPTFLFSIHVPTPNAHERRGPYVAEAVQIVGAICAQVPQTLRWRPAPPIPFHCVGFLTRGFPTAGMVWDILCSAWANGVSDHKPVILEVAMPAAAAGRGDPESQRRTRRLVAAGPTRA